jgi:hypothetical protein
MTATAPPAARPHDDDRERLARRLLRSSAERSFDPDRDVDWDAPLLADAFFLPEHRISLYGTDLYAGLTRAQRIELSRHEAASIAAAGIWFELILDQILLRHVYHLDPTSRHVRYALTEIADECRHSMMFARLIERLGTPVYGPGRRAHRLGNVMKTVCRGPEGFAATLLVEEVLDAYQRELIRDDSVQPLMRQVSRIHVTEEARHVSYARAELVRQVAAMGAAHRLWARWAVAQAAPIVMGSLVHPGAYRSVGLDPVQARRVATTSPATRDTRRWVGARLTRFLDEVGLLGGASLRLWQASGLR